MKKSYWFLILFNLAYIIGFTIYYVSIKNYEFLLYIAVLLVLFVLVAVTQKKTKFDYFILWALSIWGLMHMMGGGVLVNGETLYRYHIIDLYQGPDPELVILKFDQFVHFYLYVIVSMVLFHLLGFVVKKGLPSLYLAFFAVLGSVGIGGMNEIIEFTALVLFEKTGVGGFYNISLDLVFNFLGALVGGFIAHFRRTFD